MNKELLHLHVCLSHLFAVTSSNKGTSFVFMFMENGAPDIYNLEVVVSSASDVTTEITLHTPVGDSGFVSRHTLQPGQVGMVVVRAIFILNSFMEPLKVIVF